MFNSTRNDTNSALNFDTFTISTPSGYNIPTTVYSSKVALHRQPQRAYKQVLAKLRAGLATLKLKTKKTRNTRKPTTGSQLTPTTTDEPAERFGHPNRAINLPDAYYGWEYTAKISAKFVTGLFDCPSILPGTGPEYPGLAEFVAYALFLCQFEPQVNDHALYLLWCMKILHPDLKLAHGHGMYLAALGLAAKMAGQDDCSSDSWTMVGQWIFNAEQLETNQDRLGELLLWRLEVDPKKMAMVMKHVYCGGQPNAQPTPFPADYDDYTSSVHSTSTSSSLSSCSILSIWSFRPTSIWNELACCSSAVTMAASEGVNRYPYLELKI
ncbi:hypothetical protein V565_022410 [Rhizoctonia solani 123E]|uniref:Cyclin n=1 Tax=Rhizoctonia solani 123E TaxID=1423351 RepID=A0A074SAZ8_9AGAM|nr:hypothetical protein V565_022410 [Rhizoctonia solani 123E]